MDPKGEELAAVIAEIRDRVRARNPNGAVLGDIALPDLMPLLRARDAADSKVASIGTVNPRPAGLAHSIVQRIKQLVARAMDWHVREQVEFNRAAMGCVQATIEALTEANRTIVALSGRIHQQGEIFNQVFSRFDQTSDQMSEQTQRLNAIGAHFNDLGAHWNQWREAWEIRLANNEIHFLRTIAEQQGAFQHRVTMMDTAHRENIATQHANFQAALKTAGEEIQARLWDDMRRIRSEYETVIHAELRLLRQKASLAKTVDHVAQTIPHEFKNIDWLKFAEKFRGSEAAIANRQQIYGARFSGHAPVLDIGCGRGELLQVLRDSGIDARGIDLSEESVALCHTRNLQADRADLFEYLDAQPDSSIGGIVCSQVVEHLPPERLPELLRLAHQKLRTGGLIAIETPNPECLAIFATHFYIDPTHRHPIPPVLMTFYVEESGFGLIEVDRINPAVDAFPSLLELPAAFRADFFAYMDYTVFAVKL